MTEMPNPLPPDEQTFFGADAMRTLRRYQRQILLGAAIATALAVFIGGAWYAVLQPARRTFDIQFTLGFKPVVYPNGLRFSMNDIVAPSIIEEVHRLNGITGDCDVERFRSGFFVSERSLPLEVLDEEFRQRLSEPRVTSVERERLMLEYRERRETIPVEHRLTFVVPEKCVGLPDVVVTKSLTDVLAVWAKQSETRRGVLRLQIQALTPEVLTSAANPGSSLLVRSDLLRRALMNVMSNMAAVSRLPGADYIRLPDGGPSFRQLTVELEALLRARVEPLVAATVPVSADATNWLRDALEGAESRQAANLSREQSYLRALREYSGTAGADVSGSAGARGRADGGGKDVGALTPQIDSSFIDRLIEMASVDSEYRQQLTGDLVEAGLNVASGALDVRYYNWLLTSRRPAMPPAELEKQLQALIDASKALIVEYNALHDHYTTVSLRPDSELFSIASAPTSSRLIAFTRRSYLLLVMTVLFGSLAAGALIALAYSRRRQA